MLNDSCIVLQSKIPIDKNFQNLQKHKNYFTENDENLGYFKNLLKIDESQKVTLRKSGFLYLENIMIKYAAWIKFDNNLILKCIHFYKQTRK